MEQLEKKLEDFKKELDCFSNNIKKRIDNLMARNDGQFNTLTQIISNQFNEFYKSNISNVNFARNKWFFYLSITSAVLLFLILLGIVCLVFFNLR